MPSKLLKSTAAKRQHQTSHLIARNLKIRRHQVGMRVITLADRMAVTERQIMRWESCETRISCGALVMVANVLGSMTGDFFIKDFPEDPPRRRPRQTSWRGRKR